MYLRFTERARNVMRRANEEAQKFKHQYIGVEHVLLGLLQEEGGGAMAVLKNLKIDPAHVRAEVVEELPPGEDMAATGKLPQTPCTMRAIEHAMEEARGLGCDCVETEHLLLGLLRETDGVAARVLGKCGLTIGDAREESVSALFSPQGVDAETLRCMERVPHLRKMGKNTMAFCWNDAPETGRNLLQALNALSKNFRVRMILIHVTRN